MKKLNEILAHIEDLDTVVIKGPWRWRDDTLIQNSGALQEVLTVSSYSKPQISNSNFIAESRTLIPRLARALEVATNALKDISMDREYKILVSRMAMDDIERILTEE